MIKYNRTAPKEFTSAYDAGFDAGVNGSNTINTNFKWFRTKDNMREWERGKRNAEAKNEKSK